MGRPKIGDKFEFTLPPEQREWLAYKADGESLAVTLRALIKQAMKADSARK